MKPQIADRFSKLHTGAHRGSSERKTVATSRADVSVRRSDGEGLPILLVHGHGGTSEEFDQLFDCALAHDHLLLAVDLPGHGRSGKAADHETASTSESYAETLLETLERLDIETAFVIDRSRGGSIGRELMSIFPGVLGLAFVGDATFCETLEPDAETAPVYQIASLTEESLEPIIQNLELREAALSVAPRLWYGG